MKKRKRKWRTKMTVRRGLVEVRHYKGGEEKRMEQLQRLVCGRVSDKDIEVIVTYPKSAEAEAKADCSETDKVQDPFLTRRLPECDRRERREHNRLLRK